MQTFSFGLRGSWVLRFCGRHPLVRTSDRIETLVLVVAVTVAVLAIPVAAAVGTAVHDTRSRTYAEQAQSRHIVTARAVTDSAAVPHANSIDFTVRARWNVFGSNHDEVVPVTDRVTAGDRLDVWVDDRGEAVQAPTPPGRAGQEALGAAVLSWLCVAAAAAVCVGLSRRRLTRARYAAWDRELETLSGGGRFTSDS
ncbi:hypothetical protein [Mycolicibacterium sp.]|uniref:Rv1733c family protein n=1 Tax=Mycolicibacterium sp. TaxID=2320850 RepID=UPI001A308D25|nr:hypothetical protein [Mycolicibacterium sp.]MBJ7338119.1 hypothetical protein [Mycolicibacterium sp.]